MDFGSPDRIYVHGARVDEIVADQVGSTWTYHHYDARGHCILLTGSSGTLVEQYSYDAFGKAYYYDGAGNELTDTGMGNRFLFTGREWISDLKLYDFRNRMYQPELGRFLQPDPKEFAAGDYNLYRYCHNDPVNKSDPTGLDWYDAPHNFINGMGDMVTIGVTEKLRQNVFGNDATVDTESVAYKVGSTSGLFAGMLNGKGEVSAVKSLAAKVSQVAEGRSFRELLKDITANARDWVRQSAHTEARQAGNGTSIQQIYQNKKTGEQVVRHTTLTDKGRTLSDHFRPMYKPRTGE